MPKFLRRWTALFTPVELLTLSIVMSVAAFGRFYLLPEKLVFFTDQGRAMLAGRNILLGDFIWEGPLTSVAGLRLGPLYYYFTAIALWFSRFDPIGPAMMTASFGVAAAVVLYLYGKRYWGLPAGLTMGLAYALSPQAIWQSRIAIEPSPLPFFSLLWLWFMTNWWQKDRVRDLWFALITLVIALQLNLSALTLLSATAWLWFWRKAPVSQIWKHRLTTLFWSGILGLIIGHALARPITPLSYFLRMWQQLTLPTEPLLSGLWLGAGLATLTILISTAQAARRAPLLVLQAWLVFGLSGFWLKYVSGEHSLGLLFAFPAILLGGIVAWFWERRSRRWLLLGVVGLIFMQAFQTLSFLRAQHTEFLRDHQAVVNTIVELSQNQPYNFVYRGHLDVYDAADDHYQYLLWLSGHPPQQSARIDLTPEYAEPWLLTSAEPATQTIVFYSSLAEAERYHHGELTEIHGHGYEVIPHP